MNFSCNPIWHYPIHGKAKKVRMRIGKGIFTFHFSTTNQPAVTKNYDNNATSREPPTVLSKTWWRSTHCLCLTHFFCVLELPSPKGNSRKNYQKSRRQIWSLWKQLKLAGGLVFLSLFIVLYKALRIKCVYFFNFFNFQNVHYLMIYINFN
jgi:hypothetical protein